MYVCVFCVRVWGRRWPPRETRTYHFRVKSRRLEYSLCVGSAGSSCILTGEIFSDLGGPWKPMGPGPPAAPTRCITPAAPISAALPLLRTSRDGFRAILKPSYADHRPYPLNSRKTTSTCLRYVWYLRGAIEAHWGG